MKKISIVFVGLILLSIGLFGSTESLRNLANRFGINAYSIVCASSVFRNQSTIRYMVPRNTHVNVCVYNILGQKVTTLVNGFKDAGVYEVIWDGTDNKGTRVSSGSYFLRFQAGDYIDTKTMTVIR